MDNSALMAIASMTVAQKSILLGFLAVFCLLLVFGLLASGVFKKNIRMITLDESQQLAAIRGFLEEEGLATNVEEEGKKLTHTSGWVLSLEVKRDLPWVVFTRRQTPARSGRFTRFSRYTIIDFPVRHPFEGFVGEQRFTVRQNYAAYFDETYDWRNSSVHEDLIVIQPARGREDEVDQVLSEVRSIFERSPTDNPVIIVAHGGRMQLYFPFWPASAEQFEFLSWVLKHPVSHGYLQDNL